MLRQTLFSPAWWISTFLSTLVIMCFIVLIKRVSANIPLLSNITQEV